MTAYSIAAFHVIAGVCVLAAVRHLSNGLWRPIDKSNLLFSVMCCCAVGMAWTLAQVYQAWSIEEHAALVKSNLTFIIVFFIVMPWFTSAVTGRYPLPWLVALTVLFIALLTVNLIQPVGVQLAGIERIETKHMPWGEPFASPVGKLAPTFWLAIAAALVGLGDSAIRFLASWRRDRSGASMIMAVSAAVYFLSGIEGALVRAQIIDFIHLGPFGFFVMVIAMSLTLSFRSRHNLLVSEQRFRALVAAVAIWDPGARRIDGGTVQVNPAWERLWGKNASENPGVADQSLLPVIERAFKGHKGETIPMPTRGEQWIRSFVYPIKDPGGLVRNVIVMHEDVTEEKRAEDEARAATAELSQVKQAVVQQERLRALGQMASGIAHDINNAISPAALYVESLLEQDKTLNPRARERLTIVQQAIAAVVQTVARLREFCRPREAQSAREAVDLNDVVQQSVALTRARWYTMALSKGISIQTELNLANGLPAILGSESEIRDAIVNLIFNAVDAMPAGGTITLQTRALVNGVTVEVRDTGIGMDQQTRRRCLEPFFSTKGEQGSGLGLAMVYGMLKRHGGEIEIVSEPGQGTTMRLEFPIDSEHVERPQTTPPRSAFPGKRSGIRILLADDDPALLVSLRAALEADGHHVMTADDGQSAIDAFEAADRAGSPFAVVITDFVMPVVDGRKVSNVVNQMRPGTPVIMLTAYGHRVSTQDDTLPNVDHILAKPTNLADLRNTLERLLPALASRSSGRHGAHSEFLHDLAPRRARCVRRFARDIAASVPEHGNHLA
jgi:signal transduction histidine kinase/CheY-like chemotaxis protein